MSVFTLYKSDILPHPPYSAYVTPLDFDLFPTFKELLPGVLFEDLHALEEEVVSQIRSIYNGCLATGLRHQ